MIRGKGFTGHVPNQEIRNMSLTEIIEGHAPRENLGHDT